MEYGGYGQPWGSYGRAYGETGFRGGERLARPGGVDYARPESTWSSEREHGWQRIEARPQRRWRRTQMRVRDVMTRNPRTARPTDTLQQVAQIMVDEDTSIVPITEEGGRLLGVVTERDIVRQLVARGIDLKNVKAQDVMTDDIECVTEHDTLRDALNVMSEHQIYRVPVVARGDRLIGIISMADIAREADLDEDLQDAFEEIASERSFWMGLR